MDVQVETKKRVLVVDDDESMLTLLSKGLIRNDFEVNTAESGSAALCEINDINFDAVLLDIILKDMSGNDVLKKIREMHNGNSPIVIMLTAQTKNCEVAIDSLNNGADAYILKPFKLIELIKVLNNKLEERDDRDLIREMSAKLYVTNRNLDIANEAMNKALVIADKIVEEGKSNGVVLDDFIKEKERRLHHGYY